MYQFNFVNYYFLNKINVASKISPKYIIEIVLTYIRLRFVLTEGQWKYFSVGFLVGDFRISDLGHMIYSYDTKRLNTHII